MGRIKQGIEANFNWVIALLCLGLFIFNFWLFFPGYINQDWTHILNHFSLDNWQPVMYPFLLKKITDIFGYHIYYPLLFNLIPFYLGLYVLANGLWKKFKSKWCLLGFLPIAIGNIFFQNIVAHCSFSSPMILFLLWTILLHQLLNGITRKNAVLAGVVFFFAVLSRHNALIQAYPVCFVYGWLIVQKLKPAHRLLKYIGILFLFAVITVAISIGVPQIIKTRNSFPANHIFLHQIAGACVPNHDESCFKKEWYDEGKTFADVEKEYLENPLNADYMSVLRRENNPFKNKKLDGLSIIWLKSIVKYPLDYLKHINNFRKGSWHFPKLYFDTQLDRRNHCIVRREVNLLKKNYPKNELFYKSSELKISIHNFLKKVFPLVPTFLYVSLNFILFGISGFLFLKKKDLLLLFSLSSTVAGIAGSVIFCIFAPMINPRYIYPVLISTLISVIGLIVYFCEKGIISSCILSMIKCIRRKKEDG